MTTAVSFSEPKFKTSIGQSFYEKAEVLSHIYESDINMAVWRRKLDASVSRAVRQGLAQGLKLNITQEIPTEDAFKALQECYGLSDWESVLLADIATIIEMYGCLFDVKLVGLRLRTLSDAMCPKFHFDRVPCRLVTTYNGTGTQWLPNEVLDIRDGKLIVEEQKFEKSVQTLQEGEVALLKGSLWEGNEATPLVHRSPQVSGAQPRLLLTLDAM